jgi:L-idonate 5-dehydrogenase
MKVCVVHGAHDLRVADRPEPEPGPGQVRIAIRYGGICGSDLHYVAEGAVGDFRVRMPMVLGHEVVGTVDAVGPDRDGSGVPEVGTAVAVHPAAPCHRCPECLAGRPNICRDTRFLGSAARMPHVDGGFAQFLVVDAAQARPLPPGLSLRAAAVAEPLAVGVHAIARAGSVAGARVLVTGSGPIGVLAAAVARAAGAAEVIVSDILDEPLAVARAVGATATVRADHPDDPAWPAEVDVVIEASGTAPGLDSALTRVRRGGVVVQVGLLPPGRTPFAGNTLVSREIDLRGAFRYGAEFDEAVRLLADGLPVTGVVSAVFPLAEAAAAFALAADPRRSCKVLLDLDPAGSPDSPANST